MSVYMPLKIFTKERSKYITIIQIRYWDIVIYILVFQPILVENDPILN